MPGSYVTIPVPGGTAEAYRSGDAAGDDRPGVLLYMDAIGLRPQIERMADRIASWGYVVLAPNLFWRTGRAADLAPRADLRVPENRAAHLDTAMSHVRGLTTEQSDADTEAWLAALRGSASVAAGPVAVIGYCFGGRLALRTAAREGDGVALAGLFHTGGLVTGQDDSPHLLVPQVAGFVLACHADQDRSNPPEQIAAFDAALRDAGVPHRTAVLPGAPHGFTMEDTSSYQAEGAERHYTELRTALEAAFG